MKIPKLRLALLLSLILTVVIILSGCIGSNPAASNGGTAAQWMVQTTAGPLNSITWAANKFVAVGGSFQTSYGGGSNVVLTSPDGITWTPQNTGQTLPFYDIAYGNNRYVAVGQDGIVGTSADGVTWNIQTLGGLGLEGVTWSGTQFVAVGLQYAPNPDIYCSPDGINWTGCYTGTGPRFMDVAGAGNQFVAVGTGGTIVATSDGVNWAPQTSNVTVDLNGVAGSGTSQIVAVGKGGTILSSPDGITWTIRPSGTTQNLNDVYWTGVEFIAVGGSGTMLSSPDGISWKLLSALTTDTLNGVVASGNKFVMVGGGISTGTVLTSP